MMVVVTLALVVVVLSFAEVEGCGVDNDDAEEEEDDDDEEEDDDEAESMSPVTSAARSCTRRESSAERCMNAKPCSAERARRWRAHCAKR